MVPAASGTDSTIYTDVPVAVSHLYIYSDTSNLCLGQPGPGLVTSASGAGPAVPIADSVTVSFYFFIFSDTLELNLGQSVPGSVPAASRADTAVSGTSLEATVAREKRQPSAAGIAKHAASIKVSRNKE